MSGTHLLAHLFNHLFIQQAFSHALCVLSSAQDADWPSERSGTPTAYFSWLGELLRTLPSSKPDSFPFYSVFTSDHILAFPSPRTNCGLDVPIPPPLYLKISPVPSSSQDFVPHRFARPSCFPDFSPFHTVLYFLWIHVSPLPDCELSAWWPRLSCLSLPLKAHTWQVHISCWMNKWINESIDQWENEP